MSSAISINNHSENPSNQTSMHLSEEIKQIDAAKQNPAAFRPLYETYYVPIFRFIHRRVGEEEMAADLCSQVFLKALSKIGDYEHKGFAFSSWLYRIATNEVNGYFRKTQKQRLIALDESGLEDLLEEIEYKEEKADRLKKLEQAFQQLEPEQVQLLEWRFFESRPFKEIGEILDITENNAKTRTYRLLALLKKKLLNTRSS